MAEERPPLPAWLIATLLFGLEFIVVAAVMTEDWSRFIRDQETAWMEDALGASTALAVRERGHGWFNQLFVDTGALRSTYRALLPTEAERAASTGLQDLGRNWFFPWLEGRLDAVWLSIYQVMQRLALVVAWLPYLSILVIPTLYDGMQRRRIKQMSFDYASPLRHRGAFWLVSGLMILGFAALFFPFPVPALGVPLIAALLAVALMLLVANTQKRV